MLQSIIEWDRNLFIVLNGIHSPFWDVVMYWTSKAITFLPLYLLFIYALYKKYSKNILAYLLFLILAIGMADFGSVHLFKEVFHRLRPCHNQDLAPYIHIVKDHCGGKYGFISSHSANFFALSTFLIFSLKPPKIYSLALILWACSICYSRVYLGVHYPLDVIVGALWGILVASFIWRVVIELKHRGFFPFNS